MKNTTNTKVDVVEKALIEKAKKGDSKAFDLLVVKYQAKLMGMLSHIIKDEHEIKDIAQDSFIKAYYALPNFRGESTFFTWLYRIAINSAKNYLITTNKKLFLSNKAIQNKEEITDWIEQIPDYNTPESDLLNQEIINTVSKAVSNLPKELQEVINLREIDGLSYEEIAKKIASPVGTVRSRLFRAREMIAKDLRPVLDTAENKRW